MTHLLLLAMMLGLALPSALATPAVASDREWHTAECVAALDVNTAALAGQVKAGQEALRPLLLDRLNSGAAFVGAAYLRGERDEARAKALLKEALEAQKTLPEAALAVRQLECAEEGYRLLAQASFFEREVVSLFARRRLIKLLGPRARSRRRLEAVVGSHASTMSRNSRASRSPACQHPSPPAPSSSPRIFRAWRATTSRCSAWRCCTPRPATWCWPAAASNW
jgi:hypothetical protein